MKPTRFAAAVGLTLAAVLALGACSSSGGGKGGSSGGAGGSSGNAGGCSTAKTGAGAGAPVGPEATGTGSATLPSGMPGKGKPAITIGSKNFPEEDVLGQLYTQALKAKGYSVTLKSSLGATEVVDPALLSGKIDMYPEYTGVIYASLAGRNDSPKSAVDTYNVAQTFEEKRGYTLLNPTPFQDADGLAVKADFAKKHCLSTISDLKKIGSFTYAGPPENKKRIQGVKGLTDVYGLTKLKFIPLTSGGQYQALDQDKTTSIAIFTTDAQLSSGKYAVLSDTKKIFGFQQVAPVISKKLLAQMGPEFEAICNAVSKNLTNETILGMNTAVQINKQDAASVAKKFLEANHLV